jgi:O-antigen ligase
MSWIKENWPLLIKIAVILAFIITLIIFGMNVWENRVFFGIVLLVLLGLYAFSHHKRQRGETTAVIFSDLPALFIYFIILFAVWKQAQEQFPTLKPEAQRQREQQDALGPDNWDRLFFDHESKK